MTEEPDERKPWRYIEMPLSAEVEAGEIRLRPHWKGTMDAETIRTVVRTAAAAPALYEALKATSCRYSRTRECTGPEMCDRCAALALVDRPQMKGEPQC